MLSSKGVAGRIEITYFIAMKILRLSKDKKIAGVCGGVAEYFKIDPTWVRIAWLLITLMWGAGLIAYIVCWLLMSPAEE